MGEKGVNSHIQMPKCVLKRFENQNHSFYYYDVEKDIIGSNGHAKTTNTQFGYYSEEVEKYLNDNIEAPFAKVLQFVDKTDFDDPKFTFSKDFSESVKAFIYALLARDPVLLSNIDKNSIYNQFLPKRYQHDFAVKQGMRIARERGYFDSYTVTFSVNKTPKPFVLPICGIYSYKLCDAIHVNLPVTPQVAITLVEPKGIQSILNKDIVSMYEITDKLIVERMNSLAFKTQRNAGWGYVISPEKAVLEELLAKKPYRQRGKVNE